MRIEFRALAASDLAQLRAWLNTPHVYEWWGVHSGPGSLGGARDDSATAEAVNAKYLPEIESVSPRTHRFVIVVDGTDTGLIQHYRLTDHPEYGVVIREETPGTHGLDYFVGEASLIGRGVGSAAIHAFVHDIVSATPSVRRVVAGPHPANVRSCRALEKAGFTFVRDVEVPGEGPQRIYARDLDTTA